MRLTCPTCGAEYEVADAMVPAAGRHVQCTACHTRWFERGAVAPEPVSEDDIMRRLEARSHLRAVPSSPRVPDPEPVAPVAEPAAEPEAVAEAPRPEATTAEATTAEAPEPAASIPAPVREEPAAPLPPPPARPRAVPAKPAARPMRDGMALRPAPRLDLGAEAQPMPAPHAPPSRFGRGVLAALVLAGLALSAYLWRAELAASVPAAAPMLDAYGRTVDDLRLELDRQIEHIRG